MQLMTAKEFLLRYGRELDKVKGAKLPWGNKFNHAWALSSVIESKENELRDMRATA